MPDKIGVSFISGRTPLPPMPLKSLNYFKISDLTYKQMYKLHGGRFDSISWPPSALSEF